MEEEKQQFQAFEDPSVSNAHMRDDGLAIIRLENETDVDKLRFQFAQSKAKEARRQSFFKYLKTLVVKIQSLVS